MMSSSAQRDTAYCLEQSGVIKIDEDSDRKYEGCAM